MPKESAKKKSTFDPKRNTVGQILADTQELHQKQQIEAGEFVEEVGNKEVMKEVWRQIDQRRGLPQWSKQKWYLLVYFHKDPIMPRVIRCEVQSRHTEPRMEWDLTCFCYDPKTDQLLLHWVLPHKTAARMFLKNRDKTDDFLIYCIEKMMQSQNSYQKV